MMEVPFGAAPMANGQDPAAAKALVARMHMMADAILRQVQRGKAAGGADVVALVDLYFLLAEEPRHEGYRLEKVRDQHAEMTAWLQRYSYGDNPYPAVAASVDLAALGRDRAEAAEFLAERTALLRVGVLQALDAGDSEVAVARAAGVDRMTVRKWAGKS